MNNERFEWQTRCEFNAYCKRTLRNELIDASRERKRRQRREVTFSDLTPHEEKQLYTVDKYFANGDKEETFCVGDLKITAKLLAEALHSLPEDKRQAVLLYYFFNMTDVEIADAMKIVLQHYQSYIAYLSMQKIRDESGNTYWGIDEDLRQRLQVKLMRAVLNFKADY